MPELDHLTGRSRRRLYGSVAVLVYLLERIEPRGSWKTRMLGLLEQSSDRLELSPEAMGFPDDWAAQRIWQTEYQRDPEQARRARLISSTSIGTTAEAQRHLTARPERERRSWLRYLRKNTALVVVEYGGANYYPLFQFRDGDIDAGVAEINEKLFRSAAGKNREAANWDIFEWWVTPIHDLGGAPKDLVGAADMAEQDWEARFPPLPAHPIS